MARIPAPQVAVDIERSVVHTIHIQLPVMNRRDHSLGADDEVRLVVNGKLVKRLSMWQAERAGLVDSRPEEFV